jgi:3-mercaptopyruvate sulfurtransferase SseA
MNDYMKCISKVVNLMSVFLLVFLVTLPAAFAGDTVQSRVTTQWVADNINSVKIIDLRYKKYDESHIPSAMQMKWGAEVYDQDTEYRLPPNLSETKRVLNEMGLTPKDHIVLYDDDANLEQVMRLYWAFKYWNFPKVSIIQGGWALWEKENRPLADTRIANQKEK